MVLMGRNNHQLTAFAKLFTWKENFFWWKKIRHYDLVGMAQVFEICLYLLCCSSRHYLLNCPGSFRRQSVVGSITPQAAFVLLLALFAFPLPCDVDVAIDVGFITPQAALVLLLALFDSPLPCDVDVAIDTRTPQAAHATGGNPGFLPCTLTDPVRIVTPIVRLSLLSRLQ